MQAEQFDQWLRDYRCSYPTIGDWLDRLEDPAATLRKWRRVLEPIELDEALSVTRRMEDGELDPPLQWEQRDRTATIVRREAMQARSSRRERERDLHLQHRPVMTQKAGKVYPLGGILRALIALGKQQADGQMEPDAAAAKREQLFYQARQCDSPPPRFRCTHCGDTGLIVVWHPRCVALMRAKGELPADQRHAAVVLCSEAGCMAAQSQERANSRDGVKRKLAMFAARQHCRVFGGSLPSDKDYETFREWMREQFVPPEMAGEFSDWNSVAGYIT